VRTYRLHHAAAFKLRGVLMAPAIATLFLCTKWEWEHEVGIWTLGVALFNSGVALRVWAQRYLRYRLRNGHELATGGPYAYTRNPVYIGNLLILAGLCVMCELPWMIPVVCGWGALVYDSAVRFEETRLAKRHGEAFGAYCRRVNRWFPRSPTAPALRAAGVCAWARAARVEWQCLVLVAIPLAKETLF
jgi:protein-S-isoprenylcysteine O-methyltransferase Ste14